MVREMYEIDYKGGFLDIESTVWQICDRVAVDAHEEAAGTRRCIDDESYGVRQY